MKPIYTFVSILISIFASSLVSALIISLMFFNLPAVYFVVIYCFCGTLLFGAPISFLIHWLIKSERIYAIMLKFVLHIAAAAALIIIFFINEASGQNMFYNGGILFLVAAVINATIYFITYTCTRRLLFRDRQAAWQ